MNTQRFTGMGGHHGARPTTDVWLTPPEILQSCGGADSFDLDPCASQEQPWPTAKKHYTAADNGLMLPWFGRVWLNPPYQTHLIRAFMARMADHGCGMALIFARTETAHFAQSIWPACDALFFLEGRPHFHTPNGDRAKKNAGAPSVLCTYGSDDADVLAGLSMPGAFVPLRLRSFVHGFADDATWQEVVTAWVSRQGGGPVHLSDAYRALASHPKARRNSSYKAKIRQILQQGPFVRSGPGLWRLMEKDAKE